MFIRFLVKVGELENGEIEKFTKQMMKKYEKKTFQSGINLNYTLWNSSNGTDLMFLMKENLSLITNNLSFKNQQFLFRRQ